MAFLDSWFGGDSAPAAAWTPTASDPGMPMDEGWGFGPTDNPARSGFTQGALDTSSKFDTSGGGTDWKAIGGALKGLASDIGGAAKNTQAAQTPQQRQQQLQQETARTQAGALTQLLQLMQQQQQDYWTAAHKGTVPIGTRPGSGGLLGF